MRIGIQTWGSEGDIRPFAALAGGLARAGYDVRLLYTSVDNTDYSSYGDKLGFELARVGHYEIGQKEMAEFHRLFLGIKDPLAQIVMVMERFFEPMVERMYDAAVELAKNSELIIGHFCLHPAQLAAEKDGLPYITVTLNHSGLETAYTSPMGFPALGRFMNRVFWKLGMSVINSKFLPSINRLRRQEGMRPVSDFREVWESKLLNLIAVSPALCEIRPDWPDTYRICGFFSVEDGAEAELLPDGLMEFIGAGEPPVYMGFGSMLTVDPGTDYLPDTVGMMVDAARLAGVRAVIQAPWSGGALDGIKTDGSAFRVEKAPHGAVFPLCRSIVHHGGAGTTHCAARSGRPSLVVAHLTDQYFWGDILKNRGAAPGYLKRRGLTTQRLASGIRETLSPKMEKRAFELAERMHGEDGVAMAIGHIRKLCRARAR